MTLVVESLIDVGPGKIQVDSAGAGPGFVILHSLLTGPEAFDEVASSLSRDLTVHRVYLPGFGGSTPLPFPEPSVADLAEVVATAMERLGCDTDTTVLGNGLGSFVALTLAIGHGERFDRLVVCNTGPGFPDDRKGTFFTMSELATAGGMAAVADVALPRIFPSSYLEAHPRAEAERRAVLEEIDPLAFAASCRALARLDLGDHLAGIANPTAVVIGAIDQTTPPELGLAVAGAIPEAISVEIPGCGHCPQLEKPGELMAAIETFLSDRAA
jgi:pimeloyl-ACP methyl ester carboxylesterase